jgi:outer membrane protein assembly factor BamB
LVLAATLSGTALVAAAPPSGSRLVEVARTAAVITMRLAGSMLFAVTLSGGPHLVGYRLSDGTQRWSVPLEVSGTDVQVGGHIDVVDGAVLVSLSGAPAPVRTVAVDPATGRELWRSDLPRVFGLDVTRTVVLGAYLNPNGSPGPPPYPGTSGPQLPLLLRAVEARTGRLAWAHLIPAGWQTALPADGSEPANSFGVIAANGQSTTVDVATGGNRGSATIDATAISQRGRGDLPTSLALGVYGDPLVLVTSRQGRPILAAYQVSTLGLEWTAAVSMLDVNVSGCGSWLCVADQHGIRAIAPDTGAQAWEMTNVDRYRGWAAGWIYDEPDQTQPDAAATLIDPVTQRVVLNLGRWRIPAPSNTGPVLTMAERQSARIWLGLLTAGPRVDVLGAVTGLTQNSCEIGDRYLACLTTSAQLRIWRYRR